MRFIDGRTPTVIVQHITDEGTPTHAEFYDGGWITEDRILADCAAEGHTRCHAVANLNDLDREASE
jgi:hypothetical protein